MISWARASKNAIAVACSWTFRWGSELFIKYQDLEGDIKIMFMHSPSRDLGTSELCRIVVWSWGIGGGGGNPDEAFRYQDGIHNPLQLHLVGFNIQAEVSRIFGQQDGSCKGNATFCLKTPVRRGPWLVTTTQCCAVPNRIEQTYDTHICKVKASISRKKIIVMNIYWLIRSDHHLQF